MLHDIHLTSYILCYRKPVSKSKYCTTDLSKPDSGKILYFVKISPFICIIFSKKKFVLVKNNVISDSRRKIQQKQKSQQDSFINDESLSSDNSESMYHTASTNFRTSTDSTTKKRHIKPMPVSISSGRYIYTIFI